MSVVGKITKDGKTVAALDTAGRWHATRPELARLLDTLYDPRRATGVNAILPFGYGVLYDAAARLKGQAVPATPLEPLKPGVVS